MSTEVLFTSKHKKLQIQTKVETVQFQPSGALGIFKTSNEELINALRNDKEYGKSFGDKPDFLQKKNIGVKYMGLNPDGTPKMEVVETDSNVINGVRTSDHQPILHSESVKNNDELFREFIKLSKIIKKSDEQKTRLTELKTELKLD
jgi:hypothetical protein